MMTNRNRSTEIFRVDGVISVGMTDSTHFTVTGREDTLTEALAETILRGVLARPEYSRLVNIISCNKRTLSEWATYAIEVSPEPIYKAGG